MDEGQFKNYPLRYAKYSAPASNGGNNIAYSGAGFLDKIIFSQIDVAPTAGFISVYDSTAIYGTAETKIFTHAQTTGVFMPTSVPIGIPFTNGLSIGFTTTNDVDVTLVFKAGA